MNGFRALIALLLPLLCAVAAPAAMVTTLDDGGPGSLRQAINDAALGETIDFAVTGTIVLTGGALVLTKDVTLQGPGPGSLSISGGYLDRVVRISGASASLSGMTITAGFSRSEGAGVRVDADASLAAANCVFAFNRTVGERGLPAIDLRGGGIFNAGNTTVTDCTFDTNNAWGAEFGSFAANLNGLGGALYNDVTGALTISGSTFHLNSAAGSTSGNLSGGNGSGGAINNAGNATITDSTFSENIARGGDSALGSPGSGEGGALFNSGTLTLTNCTANENQTRPGLGTLGFAGAARGGAIDNVGNAAITNSTFRENIAGDSLLVEARDAEGGALFNSGTLTLTNCTASGNQARSGPGTQGSPGAARGGAVMNAAGNTTLKQVILAGNSVFDASDMASPNDCFGDFTSTGYNLISVDSGCAGFVNGVNGDQVGHSGTPTPGVTPGPLDPLLGPLADNGGPTDTQALLPGSSAIDAGDGSDCAATDQRGEPRPADGDGDGMAICDIGAYELQPVSTPTPTLTDTPTRVPTDTPTPVATDTPSQVPTDTPTVLSTDTPTQVPAETPTMPPTDTPTEIPTDTSTPVATDTPSQLPTVTSTLAPTDTPTALPTSTQTSRPTPSNTPTLTVVTTRTSTPSPAAGGGGGCNLAPGAPGISSPPAWLLASLLLAMRRRKRRRPPGRVPCLMNRPI